MTFVSTLEQARDSLLLPPEMAPAEVLDAARHRLAELRARSGDPKCTAIARNGAARKLKELEPLLPALELEADITALEAAAAAPPGAGIHQLRLQQKKLLERAGAMPATDERTIFSDRLAALQDVLHPVAKPVVPDTDPLLAPFRTKVQALLTALEQKEKSKYRIMGLLAEARGIASVLRDETSRAAATGELVALEQAVEQLLANVTAPPIPPNPAEARIAQTLSDARAAVQRDDLAAAGKLLDDAKAIAAPLRDPARTRADQDIAALAAALAIRENEARERARRDAEAQLQRDREAATRRAADAEAKRQREATTARQAALEAAQAEKKSAWDRIATVRDALDRGDLAGAEKSLGEARAFAVQMSQAEHREPALAEIGKLAVRREQLNAARTPRPRVPDHGTLLRLTPRSGTLFTGTIEPPMRFVARPRFLLGREERERVSRADFLVPHSFSQVGRANATLFRKGDEIYIQDGDGEKKSTNGSKLDNEVLTTRGVPASFGRERAIMLSTVFPLTAQHIPGEAPAGPPLDPTSLQATAGRTMVISSLSGAMRFVAKGDTASPVISIWLFTDAAIGAAATCAVSVANAGLADVHARMHFWQDAFWIENLRSGGTVRLGDHAIPKGEAFPLRQGDILYLGQLSYDVAIEP